MSHKKHGGSLVEIVLQRNREQSELFCSPDASLARELHWATHPTKLIAFKCMDGRLHFPLITEIPIGIFKPVRNLAGAFDLGWPYLGELVLRWIEEAVGNEGRRCMSFVSYHWSKSDKEKGCAGHDHDVVKAKASAQYLLEAIEYVFGPGHTTVYPILTGIETDEDTIVLTGVNGQEMNMLDYLEASQAELVEKIHQLFPDMDKVFVNDLLPVLEGNIRHIRFLRANPRSLADTVHAEHILAIGRGFDWMHWLNKALIIGPYSYDLAKPIRMAAKIITDNMNSGRISVADGVLLMTSGVYSKSTGPQPKLAELKARSLEEVARAVIKESYPDLYDHLHVLSGTVNENTLLFTPIKTKLAA